MIKMYRKLDRKFPFTLAATWWSSTLESGEFLIKDLTLTISSPKQSLSAWVEWGLIMTAEGC